MPSFLNTTVTSLAIALQQRNLADQLWLEGIEMRDDPDIVAADLIEEKFELALTHYQACEQALAVLCRNVTTKEFIETPFSPTNSLPLFDNLRVFADAYFEMEQFDNAWRNYSDFLTLYNVRSKTLTPYLKDEHLDNVYFNYAQSLQNILLNQEIRNKINLTYLKNSLGQCACHIIDVLIKARDKISVKDSIQLAKRILDLIDSCASLNGYIHLELNSVNERILLWTIATILSTDQIKFLFNSFDVKPDSIETLFAAMTPALSIEQTNQFQLYLADKNPSCDNQSSRQLLHSKLTQFITDDAFKQPHLPLNKTLHAWQSTSVQNLAGILQSHNTAYFDVPTGAGKTLMFVFLAKLIDEVALIVVPTKQLCYQTEARIAEYYPELKNRINICNSDSRYIDKNCRILITTYDSMVQEIQEPPQFRVMLKMKPKLVILDEVHRALAATRVEMTNVLRNSAVVIGFSATTAYNLKRKNGALSSAADLLTHNAFTYSRLDAIRDHIISKWTTVKIKLEAIYGTITRRKKLTRNKSEDHDYTAQELEKIVNTESYHHTALAIYANGVNPETGRRFINDSCVVVCNSVSHAKAVAVVFNTLTKHAYFKEKQITPAVAIHGGLTKKQIARYIQQHAEGKIAVLCGVKILLEGWDCPRVCIGFNLTPTKSEVMLAQRGGRVIRWQPNKTAIIFEFDFEIEQCFFPDCDDHQPQLISAHPETDEIPLINTDKMTRFTVQNWGQQKLKAPLIRGASKENFEPAATSTASSSVFFSPPTISRASFNNDDLVSEFGLTN